MKSPFQGSAEQIKQKKKKQSGSSAGIKWTFSVDYGAEGLLGLVLIIHSPWKIIGEINMLDE